VEKQHNFHPKMSMKESDVEAFLPMFQSFADMLEMEIARSTHFFDSENSHAFHTMYQMEDLIINLIKKMEFFEEVTKQ